MDAIFLKRDVIKGESQTEGLEDQREDMSYRHTVVTQVTNAVSGDPGDTLLDTMLTGFAKIQRQIAARKSEGAQQDFTSSAWILAMGQKGE